MGLFIIPLLLVGVFMYWNMSRDSAYVRERSKNRSREQKEVIRYFCNDDGCLKKRMKDSEYDAMVSARINSMNFRQKAIEKIGLDESEIKEIEPVNFEGYQFNKNTFSRYGKDNYWRSSSYQVSWLFFSAKQVYLYQYTFNMDEDGKKETTEEFFWKDITNFSTSSDTIETPVYVPKEKRSMLKNVDSNRFALSVPGEKFYCALEQKEYTERAIQAMKSKLREMKA